MKVVLFLSSVGFLVGYSFCLVCFFFFFEKVFEMNIIVVEQIQPEFPTARATPSCLVLRPVAWKRWIKISEWTMLQCQHVTFIHWDLLLLWLSSDNFVYFTSFTSFYILLHPFILSWRKELSLTCKKLPYQAWQRLDPHLRAKILNQIAVTHSRPPHNGYKERGDKSSKNDNFQAR